MHYIPLKFTLILLTACGIISNSYGQQVEQGEDRQEVSTAVGVSYYYRNYHCFDVVKQCELEMAKLMNRDTLIYVRSSQFHGNYEEIHGKLTQINDSIYFVEPFKHLVQDGNEAKPFAVKGDSLLVFIDSAFIGSTLKIEYLNGHIESHKIYSKQNVFWINKTYFSKANNRIYVSFDHKNPIVNETVEIVSKYCDVRYNIVFRSVHRSENFYIIINKDSIKTLNIGNHGHQCSGPMFSLDKMPINTQLPRGRKLY